MKKLRELYRIEKLPVFQNRMYESASAARECIRGDVVLVQNTETGLIYNEAFQPDLMVYDCHYQNEQAVSSVFQQHLNEVAKLLQVHFNKMKVVEIGCGKAHFFAQLRSMGFDIVGIDPTYEGEDPHIIKDYFSSAIGIQADAIVLRHVLEHIQDPIRFLDDVRIANGGKGLIYIEVPCFDWICENRSWFDIFYEHVNYFRLEDFQRIFGDVKELKRSFNGQYLSIVADLASLRIPESDNTTTFEFPRNFLETINTYCKSRKTTHENRNKVNPVIWGGASKGVIFSLYLERAGIQVGSVIDINPAKQEKFLAATGIQVISPQFAMKTIPVQSEVIVMNNNYLKEVQEITKGQFRCISVEDFIASTPI